MKAIQGITSGGAKVDGTISVPGVANSTGRLDGQSRTGQCRFDALSNMVNGAIGRFGMRIDTQAASLYLENQLEQMETEVRRTKRTPLTAFDHIPFRTGHISPGARSVAYKQITSSGQAVWVGSKSDDMGSVSVGAEKFTAPARMFGLSYGWDVEDIMESMMTGSNLPNEEAHAAKRAYDEFLNKVAWTGKAPGETAAGKDWYGLLNFPGLKRPTESIVIKDGTGSTPSEILAFLHKHANAIVKDSGSVERPERLLLPIDSFNYISTTEMTGETQDTILQRFLAQNPYVNSVHGCSELSAAGDKNKDVAIFFNPAPDKLVLDISLQMTMLALQQRGLKYEQPTIGKVVSLRVFAPGSIRIVQGI